MALINRYTTTKKGSMILTGNTLGLSSNNLDIGAFTTLDLTQQVAGFPPGTTTVWQNNESSALLNIPAGATVLYAELQWGGTSVDSSENVTAFLNNPISFTTPIGTSSVSPDPATAQENIQSANLSFYSRSQNVTALIQAAGSGTYTVGGVPATITGILDSAGWALGIVYEDPTLPIKNMTMYAGIVGMNAAAPPVDTNLSGFLSPPVGPVTGRVLITAMEGDLSIPGDQVLFGPTTGTLVNLSGPNNPANNFFGSQINDGDSQSPTVGQLDTSGTFGTINRPTSLPARYGWDITNVLATNFTTNQTQAVLRLTSTGDGYAVGLTGVELDAVEIDYGDAPDTSAGNGQGNYSTLFANNGPRHGMVNQLFLGTQVTGETDAYQSANALGDDQVQGIQDDGLTLPLPDLYLSSTTYSLDVTLTNESGSTANLYGWVDFNQNGIFETNEGVVTTVPNQVGSQNVTLNFTKPLSTVLTPGNTFARIRLTTDSLINTGGATSEDTRSLGLAMDGEVEDYLLTIQPNPQLTLTKTVDKAIADVGDVLNYTIVVRNSGSVSAENILFSDTIPNDTTFVAGSLRVDNVVTAGNLNTGITLSDLGSAQAHTVTFQVTVDTIPTPNPIPNAATSTFENVIGDTFSANSNIVTTLVTHADLNITKSVDKAYADIGDVLTYSFIIRNTGNATAINVVLTDPIPNGTTFVTGSTLINGGSSGNNPVTGINIPSIPAGGSATVSFRVTVNSLPTPNPILDTGTLNYQYIVDPTQPPESVSKNSNTVTTLVNHADLIGTNSSNFVKSVDKAYANVGDTLTYSFTINNTGNVTATNVVLTDTIPNGTSFLVGSVLVNGGATGDSPVTGINIPSIPAGGNATVSFQVRVDTIPIPNPILDTGSLAYKYTVDPSQPPVSAAGNSNTVTTQVNNADLIGPNGTNFVKSADKAYAEVGSTITYTYTVKNTGNTVATNIILTDPVPNGTSFISGSTLINGLSSPDSPITGINVPNILPGSTATVSFKVLVNEIPVPNPTVNIGTISYKFIVDPNQPPVSGGGNSNEVKVKIEEVILQVVKSTDKTNVIAGDIITYATVISNSGTVTAQNVIFTDPIPLGSTFVNNSVTINGVPNIGGNPSSGLNVGNIAPGGFVTVTFKVTVNTPATVSPINNQGKVDYKVQIDPNGPLDNRSGNSNIVSSYIQKGELSTVKTVDQNTTKVGSTLTYTISVTNTGTVPVQNAILTDTIPSGTTLVANSVKVNGIQIVGADPSTGINLGTIPVGGQAVVTFQVLVAFVPCPSELINQGTVNFQFNLANRTETFTGTSTSNGASTDVDLKSFKQISVDGNLTIPSQKPDAEDVLEAVVSVEIVRTEIIKTPIGESYEGQTLTGWKAIIYGKLREKIRYVADEPTQSVHGAHFDVEFTTFIVLPSDFKKCCPIRIVATVEDVYVQLLDKRTIFKNVTLLIEAKTC